MRLIKHDSFFNDPWTDLDRLFETSFPELYSGPPFGREAGPGAYRWTCMRRKASAPSGWKSPG